MPTCGMVTQLQLGERLCENKIFGEERTKNVS